MYFSLYNDNEFCILISGNFNSLGRNNFQISLFDNFINWEDGVRKYEYEYKSNVYREFEELIQKYFLYNFNSYITKSNEHFEKEVMFSMKDIFPFYIQVILKDIENKFKKFKIKTHIYENDAYFIKLYNINTSNLKDFLDYLKEQFLEKNFNKKLIEYIKNTKIIYDFFKKELDENILKEINFLIQAKNFDLF